MIIHLDQFQKWKSLRSFHFVEQVMLSVTLFSRMRPNTNFYFILLTQVYKTRNWHLVLSFLLFANTLKKLYYWLFSKLLVKMKQISSFGWVIDMFVNTSRLIINTNIKLTYIYSFYMCKWAIAWFFFFFFNHIDFTGFLVYNTTHIDMYFCSNHAMTMTLM